jgi:hemin uptake protein HemP
MTVAITSPDIERIGLPVSSVSWTSEQILKGTSEVTIVHNGEKYRLKCTKNNRLILTK